MKEKLNIGSKEMIKKAYLTKAFSKPVDKLTERAYSLASEVWKTYCGEHEKALSSIPQEFLSHRGTLYLVSEGGECFNLPVDGGISEISGTYWGHSHHFTKLCVTASEKNTQEVVFVTSSNRALIPNNLVAKIKKLSRECDGLFSAYKEAAEEVDKVLKAVKTKHYLLELWPESVDFIPEQLTPVPVVINVDSLNKVLKQYG